MSFKVARGYTACERTYHEHVHVIHSFKIYLRFVCPVIVLPCIKHSVADKIKQRRNNEIYRKVHILVLHRISKLCSKLLKLLRSYLTEQNVII